MKRYLRYSLWCLALCLYACNSEKKPAKQRKDSTKKEQDKPKERLSFTALKGIKFYEVKRRFSNGLSFDEQGFQQEPSWEIEFYSNDSILAYSPQKKIWQGFHLHYDHGDVYNFAKEWFRIKYAGKDSLVFQRLHVTNKEIAKDIRSDVNITYYSKDYIQNVLKADLKKLQQATYADTLFIQKLSLRSNRNPASRDSAFAARQPVVFQPLSKIIRVEKLSMVDELKGRTVSFDYLYPRYRIQISNAYKDFAHDFMAVVDQHGKIHLSNILGILPEDYEVKKKVIDGIIEVYLQNLLKITPGTTLNMPHSSEINLIVTGREKR
jgi:hypothetical protein